MIVSAVCVSFLNDALEGLHDFNADTLKLALYREEANLDHRTIEYTTDGEVVGDGYQAGGVILTMSSKRISGKKVLVDFEDVTITESTITARGAMIYNASKFGHAVAVWNFGVDKVSQNGTFIIQFPKPDARNAILRIAGP